MERISPAEFFSSGSEVEGAAAHPPISNIERLRTDVERELHREPFKWAAIAAAVGLGLGFAGRYLRHRVKVRKRPQLYVIEGC